METRLRENSNKLIEWKAFVDAVGIKGADLKNESAHYAKSYTLAKQEDD